MNKNDVFEIEITDMNSLGVGVGKLGDGMVVFVSGAVTGDLVRAKVIKTKPSFVVARLEEVITPSPDRECNEFCPSPLSCGGCTFRSLRYARELDAKRSFVRGEFIKQGLSDVVILPVEHIEGGERAYRNKAQFPIGARGGKCVGGFYSKKSHDIIPIKSCSLQPDVFSQILAFVCSFADGEGIAPYDEESDRGILRHLFIRQAKATGEIMLTLVARAPIDARKAEKFAKAAVARFPQIVSVMENINREKTNVILGEEYRLVYGRDYIEDILLGRRFRISAPSFYQVNHDCAELLYSIAAREAGLTGRENLLDLYCGAGTIGLCLADRAKTLVGVEIVPQAIECAKENARINNIENAHFFCADASSTEKLLQNAESSLGAISFDVAVMDPPAKGSTPELINFIAAHKIPKVVYVSCGPDTLARDCALFRSLGYKIGAVTPVDMFPRTGHCECVVGLSRDEAVHAMRLAHEPFEMIKSAQKTIELRLYDEKRQKIKVGDRIVFTDTSTSERLTVRVEKLYRFDSFDELYKSLPLLECGYTRETLSGAKPSDMQRFYSAEEEKKYGVVGIGIERLEE